MLLPCGGGGLDQVGLGFVKIHGHDAAPVLHPLGGVDGFAPRRRRAVEDRLARLRVEHADDEDGGLVLYWAGASGEKTALEDGAESADRDRVVGPDGRLGVGACGPEIVQQSLWRRREAVGAKGVTRDGVVGLQQVARGAVAPGAAPAADHPRRVRVARREVVGGVARGGLEGIARVAARPPCGARR